ncbi:unnamed protein product [Auanema sp. JU1783]|nr:unnamed protein product [Auanema sp. JU1783]
MNTWKHFYFQLACYGVSNIKQQIDDVVWEIVHLNCLIRDFSLSERDLARIAKREKADCAKRLSQLEVQLHYTFKIKIVLEEVVDYGEWSFYMDHLIKEMGNEIIKVQSGDFTRRRG